MNRVINPSEMTGDFANGVINPSETSMFLQKDHPLEKTTPATLLYSSRPFFTKMGRRIAENHLTSNVRFRKILPQARFLPREQGLQPSDHGRGNSNVEPGTPIVIVSKPPFGTLQEKLIDLLRAKLLKSRFYSINELHKPKNFKKPLEDELLSSELKAKIAAQVTTSGKAEFVKLCGDDRLVSRSFQTFIETCEQELWALVQTLLENSIPDLIFHPLGNYVLQIGVRRSQLIASRVEDYCFDHLKELLENEFASRVMQTAAEVSPSFRRQLLLWAGTNLGLLMETLPAVFALTAAISSVISPDEIASIRDQILSPKARQFIKNRFFKRILMSFLEKCHEEDIDRVYKTYSIGKQLLSYLNDKFGAFILVAIIRRGHRNATALFLQCLRDSILDFYGTKFFKFVFFRLTKDTILTSSMLKSLVSMKKDLVKAATDSRSACYFFCYLVVATLQPSHSLVLVQIERGIQTYGQLRDILLRLSTFIET